MLVADEVLLGHARHRDAAPRAVDAAPRETVPHGRDGEAVIRAAHEADDVVGRQAGDQGRGAHDGVEVGARALGQARLAVAVEAPGEEDTGAGQREGVVCAAADGGDGDVLRERHTAGHHAPAQLVLLA